MRCWFEFWISSTVSRSDGINQLEWPVAFDGRWAIYPRRKRPSEIDRDSKRNEPTLSTMSDRPASEQNCNPETNQKQTEKKIII